jgi:hypothetical protein
MKKLLLLVLISSAIAFKASAQEAFSLPLFLKHVGKKVTLCETVTSFKLFNDTLTMLNMGGDYPNQKFTVVVTGREIQLNLDDIKGKHICVTGDKSTYLGKPEILIYHPDQIVFK